MVIEEINKVIRWYLSLASGYNNVNELMYNRQQLIGHLVNYTAELGNLRIDWNNAQAIRENKRAKIEFENRETPTKAAIIAKANTQKELTIEKRAEGMYFEHRENIDAIKEVLSAMNQHIAQSRDEWKQQKFINQSQA